MIRVTVFVNHKCMYISEMLKKTSVELTVDAINNVEPTIVLIKVPIAGLPKEHNIF